MKTKILFIYFLIFGNIEFAFSQIQRYETFHDIDTEVQKYLIEKNEIDTISDNSYLLFSVLNNARKVNFENESFFIIRAGCSICYDYLLFKNKSEFEIVDPEDLKVLVQSVVYFLQDEPNDIFYKYLNRVIEKHKDNIEVKKKRNKKVMFQN